MIKLIERDAKELNVYADLAEGIHGVTYFDPPRKPKVRIARELFTESWRVHRLRFTLAHEYAHVRIHAPLYNSAGIAKSEDHKCKDQEIEPSDHKVDWMEWQAGYAAGALLMPVSRLKLAVEACLGKATQKFALILPRRRTSSSVSAKRSGCLRRRPECVCPSLATCTTSSAKRKWQ